MAENNSDSNEEITQSQVESTDTNEETTEASVDPVSYTHLTLPTTPYV